MVAITVVLAAVIGAMVFGLTDDIGETAPSASLSFDDGVDEPHQFYVIHDGGDTLNTDDLSVLVNGSTQSDAEFETPGEFNSGERLGIEGLDDGPGISDVAIRHDPSGTTLGSGTANVTA